MRIGLGGMGKSKIPGFKRKTLVLSPESWQLEINQDDVQFLSNLRLEAPPQQLGLLVKARGSEPFQIFLNIVTSCFSSRALSNFPLCRVQRASYRQGSRRRNVHVSLCPTSIHSAWLSHQSFAWKQSTQSAIIGSVISIPSWSSKPDQEVVSCLSFSWNDCQKGRCWKEESLKSQAEGGSNFFSFVTLSHLIHRK